MTATEPEMTVSLEGVQARWLYAHGRYVRQLRTFDERDPGGPSKLALVVEDLDRSLQDLLSAKKLRQ